MAEPHPSAWHLFSDLAPRGPGPLLFRAPFDDLVRIGGRRPGGWGIGWAFGEPLPSYAPGVYKTAEELARDGWLWAEIPQ